jgi:hypothetical protein
VSNIFNPQHEITTAQARRIDFVTGVDHCFGIDIWRMLFKCLFVGNASEISSFFWQSNNICTISVRFRRRIVFTYRISSWMDSYKVERTQNTSL